MKRHLLFLLALLLSVVACSDNDAEQELDPGSVNIRIRNTSESNYKDVFVNTSGGEFNYGNINSSHATDYQEFESAYSYAYIRLYVGDHEYTLRPIDYVGETKLENGKYTYEIEPWSDEQGYHGITLNFIED